MLTAYKFRLYPNEEQQVLFSKYFGCNRVVWNKALALKEEYYKEHKNNTAKKGLNYYDTARFLTSLKKKEEYKWLKEVNSQSLQQSLIDLDKAFKNFFKGVAKYPNYKKKSNKQSFRVPQFFNFDDSVLYLPKFGKGIKMKEHREFPREKVKQVTISKVPSGKYFVSILVSDSRKAPKKAAVKDNSKTIGIDVGIKDSVVLSNGIKIDNPKYLKKSEKLLKLRQKQLSRKKLGSNNFHKSRIKVAKIHERITNQRHDFLHKVSDAITKHFDTIAVETLNIGGMKKNHRTAKAISDVGIGNFFRFLKYKAENRGKNILEIGMFDPSSKMCHYCRHINEKLTLSEREWECPNCHAWLDRDLNAAINIRDFGLEEAGIKLRKPRNQGLIPSVRGKSKPVENPLTAELIKMKIKFRSTSHGPEKQEALWLAVG
ncbi:MAG: transposase [Candidatus Parvarchaeota archaeon]|jgi:putative transposase|nr:transposase [Candidatus Parvarchaeota archaeon]MCL5420126.1 transposase [Candidatus Parvarchaeota archaeon]